MASTLSLVRSLKAWMLSAPSKLLVVALVLPLALWSSLTADNLLKYDVYMRIYTSYHMAVVAL